MVRALRTRPAEWLTFRELSRLIANRELDENLLGAMADYRKDIFATTCDRKLKLREEVIEETAHRDLGDWAVPERRASDERRELRERVARAIPRANGGCYCDLPESEILEDIYAERVPNEALILSYCWKTISRTRLADETAYMPPDIWVELCRRPNDIRWRENPNDRFSLNSDRSSVRLRRFRRNSHPSST